MRTELLSIDRRPSSTGVPRAKVQMRVAVPGHPITSAVVDVFGWNPTSLEVSVQAFDGGVPAVADEDLLLRLANKAIDYILTNP